MRFDPWANKPEKPADDLDILAAPPKRGEGVRRLNSKPLLIVGGVGLMSMAVLIYSMHARAEAQNRPKKEEAEAVEATRERRPTEPAVLVGAPTAGIVDPDEVGAYLKVAVDPQGASEPVLVDQRQPGAAQNGHYQAGPGPAPATYASPYETQWRQYDQAKAEQQQARLEKTHAALSAASSIDVTKLRTDAPSAAPGAGLQAALAALGQAAGLPPASPPPAKGGVASEPTNFYSPARLEAARSATEIKAGTVIPAVMVGGINSELPGQVVGQVSRNVYDSTTGRYLLIPQGSRLVGNYNSDVAYGQSRVMVAWNRLILPDGSSFDLGTMPGADQGGYAGFKDRVNNHYGRTFGSALMVSLFSAGLQLSQPQATNGENISAGQTAAGAIGQEVGQLGMEIARKNLSIAPELMARPGYRFNVQVTKDLILREWRAR